MTGQQGGAPGQPGSNAPQDQESTQVGMPVPPAQPVYSQQPPPQPGQQPPAYGQGPGYVPPPPPGYGGQPPAYGGQPPTYGGPPPGGPPPGGYPPSGYGYGAPPPKRGGPSLLVLGAIGLALVLLLGVGGMYAFGLGPFAPAASPTAAAQVTPTPKPTQTPASATATPTEAPASQTASPPPETTAPATTAPATTAPATAPATTPGFSFPPFTIPPIGTPGPSPSMSDADTALLAHVPEDFRDSCTPNVPVTPAIADLDCNTGFERGIFMNYTSYPDIPTMNTAYQFYVTAFGTGAGDGTCETSSDWPAEGTYTIDNVNAGRLLCAESGGLPTMYWTDERLNILSWSFGVGEVTADDMWSFWANEAGPF